MTSLTTDEPVGALDIDALEHLNKSSITKSFVPRDDVDWTQETTDEEYNALFDVWSLLIGSPEADGLDDAGRIAFAKYQQMNLMAFTGYLERYGIISIAELYDMDEGPEFREYVGHFIREEISHYTMFSQAIEQIHATMPGLPALPIRRLERVMRGLFWLIKYLPGRSLRMTTTFTVFRFAERVTMIAHQFVARTLNRPPSFVAQIWRLHAIDEARHLKFDDIVINKVRPHALVAWIPRVMALVSCVFISLLLNGNEVWAARKLGLQVGFWSIPRLMRRTTAPFKRRIFELMSKVISGED